MLNTKNTVLTNKQSIKQYKHAKTVKFHLFKIQLEIFYIFLAANLATFDTEVKI